MATVFLGYRRIAYDRLELQLLVSITYRTNIHVTGCHEAETLTKLVS